MGNKIGPTMKNSAINDVEAMAFRLNLNYNELRYLSKKSIIDTKNKFFVFPPGIYKVGEFVITLKTNFCEILQNATIAIDIAVKSVMTKNGVNNVVSANGNENQLLKLKKNLQFIDTRNVKKIEKSIGSYTGDK